MQLTTEQLHLRVAITLTARMQYPKAETLYEALDELLLYYRLKPKGAELNEGEIQHTMNVIEEIQRELITASLNLEKQFNNSPQCDSPLERGQGVCYQHKHNEQQSHLLQLTKYQRN